MQKKLRDKLFNFAKSPKCVGYQRVFASMIYKFSDKKSTSGGGVKNKNMSYQKLAKELK